MEEIMSGFTIDELALYVRLHGFEPKNRAEVLQCLHWMGIDVSTIEVSNTKEDNNG